MTEETFQSINPSRKWIGYDTLVANDLIVDGYFEGQQPGKFSGDNYYFQSVTGEHIAINGCASLRSAMEIGHVELGTRCRVIYGGKKILPANHKFAGKPSHLVELQIAAAKKQPEAPEAVVADEDDGL